MTADESRRLLGDERAINLQKYEHSGDVDSDDEQLILVDDSDSDDLEEGYEDETPRKIKFSWKKLWAFTGPGWLMSIAYLDPGNIESDLQAGYVGKYHLLWVLLWATIFGIFMQILALRIGVVTGKHLAEICRERYSTPVRIILWIMTEIAIIGSDIQEVLGSAIAINLLSNDAIPLWAGCLITATDTFTFLLIERYGVRKLEAFFALLIGTMAVTFGIEYVRQKADQGEVIKGTIVPQGPSYDNEKVFVTQAVGMIGAVIMPHNVYLHSALVKSRKINRKKAHKVSEAIYYNTIESSVALLISFIINLFVVAVFAESRSYFQHHITDADGIGCYTSSQEKYQDNSNIPGLLDGGCYLKKHFGKPYLYIWALGVLAAGQSSTMTGTYAGQFVMQGFLRLEIAAWKRTLMTRTIAILPAVIVGTTAATQVDVMGTWLNVLQNVQLPFAVLPILIFTSDPKLMGQWVNPRWVQIAMSIFAVAIIAVNIYLIEDTIQGVLGGLSNRTQAGIWVLTIACLLAYGAYMFLITYKGIKTIVSPKSDGGSRVI